MPTSDKTVDPSQTQSNEPVILFKVAGQWLTRTEAANYLRMSERSFADFCKATGLEGIRLKPASKQSKLIFDKDDLDRAMRSLRP